MSLKRYFYLTAIPDVDVEIINAECLALTESAPNLHGLAISSKCTDVSRGAYVRSCSELLFEGGSSYSEICTKIRTASLYADDFIQLSCARLQHGFECPSLSCRTN